MKTAEEILIKSSMDNGYLCDSNGAPSLLRSDAIKAMNEYGRQVAEAVRAECADQTENHANPYVIKKSILSVDINQFIK